MTTPEPPPGGDVARARGTHRAEQQSRSLLLPLLAVLAVLAALGLAGYMLLTNTGSDEVAGTGTTNTPLGPTESKSPTTSPTDEPSKKPTKKPTKEPTNEPTKKPDKEPSAEPVPQTPLYVFNQTGITGLAAQMGSEFDAAGWNVVGVDNWMGTVPEDTVYYYPGDKDAARRLSKDFPDIARVWPASSPMPGNSITVILATTDRK